MRLLRLGRWYRPHHISRSDLLARDLDQNTPAWVHRVLTGGRQVTGIATEIITLTGWATAQV
ncbi:hypothetical protein KZ829_17765 [Actinoplanes hulinensis]|uniref:Uncharacterized protein n=1 Tax=Actinoplanes hulinensis TaxID=1144547 RepID=A0ABS7B4K5_9ACTN|nr:hypothetical protein [Actinoplanes hulinensis]MBW6435591.1 hypothetical protein [Actinoplanes hulinensis]